MERASGVEWASCLFHFRASRMPTPLLFIRRFSNAYSLVDALVKRLIF
ncbi:MAG: hypothetical protein F6K65_08520 [Moorea sp. SIO3C2]|nr:hypothetical protein [Moorena sp. SIO3C2]